MSKKIYAVLLPLLAVAAFGSMAGAAQAAEPHWYSNGTKLKFEKEGELFKTPVVSWGSLKLKDGTITITCKVLDEGNIWNTVEGSPGHDEITFFLNHECSSAQCATATITAKKLPWSTVLVKGTPVKDKITGIEIEVNCAGTILNLKGTLEPNIVNGSASGGLSTATFAEFTASTGTLEGATVEGHDHIAGYENGELITVKEP